MRRLAFFLLLTFFFPAVEVSLRAQQPTVKEILLANEKKFSDLQIQHKCDEAANLLAEDFQGTGGPSDSKSDFLQSCKSGEIIWHSEQFSNVEFRLHTPSMSVVSYRDDFDCTFQGRPQKGRLFVSSVWLKDGKGWLMHLHTASSDPMVLTEGDKLRLLYFSGDKRDEAAAQEQTEAEIISLEKRLWNGEANDVSKLEAVDFEAIKHAHRYSRADDEAAAKEAKFDLVSMEDVRVRMLRPDVALLTYHATEKGSFRGTDVPPSLYFASIWVNRGGEWKNLFLEENLPDAFTDTYLPGLGSKTDSALQKASENSTTNVAKEVLQAENALLNTYINGDVTARERFAADDLVIVDYDGVVTTKQDDIEDIKSGTFVMKWFKMTNDKVSLLSPDVALLTYDIAYAASDHGADASSPHSRVVAVYHRKDGVWRCAFTQETKVKETPVADEAKNGSARLNSSSGRTAADLKERIIANEKEVWELSAGKEMEAYSKLLTDDAIAVYSDGYASKADVIAAIRGMGTDEFHYSMEDVRVIPIGDAAGLIVYKAKQDWKEGDKKLAREYYVGSLWRKDNGKWQSPFWQETDTTLPDDQLSAQGLAKEREIQEAQKQGDWSKFADLLSDDLVAIDEDGIRGKKELLDEIRTSDFHLSDYKMEDVKTIPEGNDLIVAYKQTHVGTQHGKPFAVHIYTHSRWQRRGDKWVLTMYQDSTANK